MKERNEGNKQAMKEEKIFKMQMELMKNKQANETQAITQSFFFLYMIKLRSQELHQPSEGNGERNSQLRDSQFGKVEKRTEVQSDFQTTKLK